MMLHMQCAAIQTDHAHTKSVLLELKSYLYVFYIHFMVVK